MIESEELLKEKRKMPEDAKTILMVVESMLYGKDLTPSQITRAWNVVQAMSATFRDMVRTDNPAKFIAERKRLHAAYSGLVDIFKLDRKDGRN